MSEEKLYIQEVGDIAPKPSAVRRSGRINFARKNRLGRPGLNPPAIRRLTAQQHNVDKQDAQRQPLKTTPGPSLVAQRNDRDEDDSAIDVKEKTAKVDDKAVDDIVHNIVETEEKKLDTTDTSPQSILDDKIFGFNNNLTSNALENKKDPAIVESDATSDFMPSFEEIQETNDGEKPSGIEAVSSVPDEPQEPSKEPVISSKSFSREQPRTRVYHRPHTNQTVVLGSKNNDDNDNDSKSTASGLSQPSWGGRRMKNEEEEDLSQTSVGNTKRRARMSGRKKKVGKASKTSDSGNSNIMGYVVSQAFDNLLGYAGGQQHDPDDGYSTDGSVGMMNDWQEAILSTLGCAVPRHGKTMKTNATFDDTTTVGSNHTGGLSNHSSVRHVRSGSNLSGSVFSAFSGVGSATSFDTTEELADFSRDKKRQQSGNYKIPDVYDANPPTIPQQKSTREEGLYSEDLYSGVRDFEPVDLLSEGDSMLDSVGKDLLNVANTKVDEMFTSIQDYLGAPPNEADTNNTTSESTVLLNALSNITEPLEVITENDVEGTPIRRRADNTVTENEFNGFENHFETNVFGTLESGNEAKVVEIESELSEDLVINETESATSLFQGIDEQEGHPEDLLPEAETNQSELIKVSENITSKTEEGLILTPSSLSIEIKGTDTTNTTATSSEKASTGSITVDREGPSPTVLSEIQSKDNITPAAPSSLETSVVALSEPSYGDVASKPKSPKAKTPVVKSTKAVRTSFQAAVKAPEAKKSKKFGGIKGLFSRKKKNKKGVKIPDSGPLALMSEFSPQDSANSTLSQSVQEETIATLPLEATQETPSHQVDNPSSSLEPVTASASEKSGLEGTAVDTEKAIIKEQPDLPVKESSNVGDEAKATTAPISCPTTPVRDPEGIMNTPKMSNLGLEGRKITRPVSGTNLADLPGIDEARSFREDPPASPVVRASQPGPPNDVPSNQNVGFGLSFEDGHVAGFEKLQRTSLNTGTLTRTVSAKSFDENEQDVSFDSFNLNLDLGAERSWESFGNNSDDVGHAAFKQFEDANKGSPQKVSAFPVF